MIALYARGLSTREIQAQLEELYGVDVSPTLISNVTDRVLDDVRAWQNRPLDPLYPIVYFDALVVKSREDTAPTLDAAEAEAPKPRWNNSPSAGTRNIRRSARAGGPTGLA